MAKGDTGRSKRPSKDDSASLKKKDSGSAKAIKKQTGSRKVAKDPEDDEDEAPKKAKKRDSARAERAASAPPPRGMDAKKIFVYATPFTMLILLGFGYYLYSIPDKPAVVEVKLDYQEKIDGAQKKYFEAQKLYKEGLPLEGDAGAAKLRQAKNILSEAQEIINGVRDEMEKLDAKEGKTGNEKDPQGRPQNYAFEDLAQKIDMLMVDCNKELRAK